MSSASAAEITVPSPPPGAIAAGLATGSVALLMLGLQPLLLGTLADERRLTVDGIGAAATAELLTLGATTGLLATFAKPVHLRAVNIAASLLLAVTNVWGAHADHVWLIASRAAAGIASGVLVWIAISLITHARRPDRVSGVFLTAQTIAQAILAALLPVTLMPDYGANGGLLSLAVLAVAATGFSFWLPSSMPVLHAAGPEGGGVPRIAFLGLLSVFLWMAGIVGLWVFVEQLGSGPLIGARIAGFAVAAALAAQVTGSSAATFLSGRLPTIAVLSLACLLNVGATRVLSGPIGPAAYLGSVLLFGFLWMFALPFQTRLLIQLDPSRRAALLLAAAQLLGSAAGPMITSSFATGDSLTGALNADAALFGAGALCLMAIPLLARRKAFLF